ncbi:MAG TPA: hypothetical protein VF397_08585, partial [Pyrinomonadaceae bacterium]
RGSASKSYGIEVARLAGMPPAALTRAREVLRRLERYELDVFAEEGETKERAVAAGVAANSSAEDDALSRAATSAARRRIAAQSSLFDLANQKIVDELRATKVEEMTADEAKELLAELRKKVM